MSSSRRTLPVAAVLLTVVATACAAVPRPTRADAERSGHSIQELAAGRARYLTVCSDCHAVHRPPRFTADEWELHMERMAPLAALDDAERVSILAYLTTFAKRKTN